MDAKSLAKNFNIMTPEMLTWKRHYSGLYDCATVGDYVIYKDLETGEFEVTYKNTVCKWCKDLSKYI